MCKIYVLSEKVVCLKRAMFSKWEKTLCEGDKSVSKRGKKLSKIELIKFLAVFFCTKFYISKFDYLILRVQVLDDLPTHIFKSRVVPFCMDILLGHSEHSAGTLS